MKIRRGGNINMDVLAKLFAFPEVQPGELLEFVPEDACDL